MNPIICADASSEERAGEHDFYLQVGEHDLSLLQVFFLDNEDTLHRLRQSTPKLGRAQAMGRIHNTVL